MKIVFMTSGTIKSSLSYRAVSFAIELVKKGHEVYIFAPRFDKYSSFKDGKVTNIKGVKIIRPMQITHIPFMLGLIPYVITSAILLFKLNPNVVHIQKATPITLSPLLLQLIHKTPLILDLDDLDSEVMKIEKSSILKIKLVELSENILLKYVNGLTVASTFLQNVYSKKVKNKKVLKVSNGAEFTGIESLSLQRVSHAKIIFIGNMNRINILEPLFYATEKLVHKIPVLSISIIGDGNYLYYFKDLVKKLHIEKHVTFYGHVPQSKLHNYTDVGDIGYCYMPNERTTKACSSMKVFQYMQFGIVPVVSNVGDLPEYTYNNKAGYIIENYNLPSLINTLENAITDKESRKEKLLYIIKHAKGDYQWSVLADKLEKLYISII